MRRRIWLWVLAIAGVVLVVLPVLGWLAAFEVWWVYQGRKRGPA